MQVVKTLCAIAAAVVLAIFFLRAIDETPQVAEAPKAAEAPRSPSSYLRPGPLLKKAVVIRHKSKFEKEFNAFADELLLSEDERAKLLTAFYDAQESLKAAPRESDLPKDMYIDIRSDVYMQFAEDLIEILGDRYELALSKHPYLMLFEAEDTQALSL